MKQEYNAYSGYGPSGYNDLTGDYANADWGVYNKISNGGNTDGLWRTLSSEEWKYLLSQRKTPSMIRFAKGIVNGVNGLIILPDNWNGTNYVLSSINYTEDGFNSNTISADDWMNIFEPNGAVFIPAAGWREGITLKDLGERGSYWSTTHDSYSSNSANAVIFTDSGMNGYNYNSSEYKKHGLSVRLVQELD